MDKKNKYKSSWRHAYLIASKYLKNGSVSANVELKNLLDIHGSIDALFDEWTGMFGLQDQLAANLDKAYSKLDFDYSTITVKDENYPTMLRGVTGAPPILYCMGNLSLLKSEKVMAVVGSRQLPSQEVVDSEKNIVARLVKSGYVIVSGLAAGADTIAHRKAIDYGGKTIAVLGTPLDVYFPKENELLQREIASSNLLVSEYPIGVETFGSNFAHRNLTTVSLAGSGVVVVHATDKSGTQHSIKTCIAQEKPLYVLENNLLDKNATWIPRYKPFIKLIRN